ncbi:MAG: hypothetical protein IJE97_16700 [Thermoguttaceae bacterium]|nr:hypothetical protein [Thermoguttaceae bacterium]
MGEKRNTFALLDRKSKEARTLRSGAEDWRRRRREEAIRRRRRASTFNAASVAI